MSGLAGEGPQRELGSDPSIALRVEGDDPAFALPLTTDELALLKPDQRPPDRPFVGPKLLCQRGVRGVASIPPACQEQHDAPETDIMRLKPIVKSHSIGNHAESLQCSDRSADTHR